MGKLLAPPQLSHLLPLAQEPYLQSQCDCCSYRLDPENPVRILNLRCPGGRTELVVLPVIHSCQCSACQGGCGRGSLWAGSWEVGRGRGLGRGRGSPEARSWPGRARYPTAPRVNFLLRVLLCSIPLLIILVGLFSSHT